MSCCYCAIKINNNRRPRIDEVVFSQTWDSVAGHLDFPTDDNDTVDPFPPGRGRGGQLKCIPICVRRFRIANGIFRRYTTVRRRGFDRRRGRAYKSYTVLGMW